METINAIGVQNLMPGVCRTILASRLLVVSLPIALLGASASAETASIAKLTDPLRFFEGRTESVSTVKVMMRKPFHSRAIGRGEISEGVLNLVQQIHEDGRTPYDRRWRMRQIGPGRFAGTMTEAIGPVIAEEIDGQFRFRFKMKGNLSIEQWLTPLPGGRSARSKVSIRKLGITVGHSEGMIHRL